MPAAVHDPRTEAQLQQRGSFRAQVKLAAQLRAPIMRGMTTAARAAGLTPYNLFMHLNHHCFSLVEGKLQVDWAGLQLSAGPVAPVASTAAESPDGQTLTVRFEKNPTHRPCSAHDSVSLYLYSPTLSSGYLSATAYRREKQISLVLPEELVGQRLQLYLIVRDEQDRASTTAYAGEWIPSAAAGSEGGAPIVEPHIASPTVAEAQTEASDNIIIDETNTLSAENENLHHSTIIPPEVRYRE